MKGRKLVALAVPLMLIWMAVPALARSSSAENPKYDPATEVTIKGTVEEVKEVPGPKGEASVHLMVKSGGEMVEVCLCPTSFLKEFEVAFKQGDEVRVTGSKVKAGDKEVILARVIESGNNTTTLRDRKGVPAWTWLTKGGTK